MRFAQPLEQVEIGGARHFHRAERCQKVCAKLAIDHFTAKCGQLFAKKGEGAFGGVASARE